MKNTMKRNILIIVIVCLCMSCSIIFTYNRSRGLLRDEYENELRMESGVISSAVVNSFLRPITVSETMSKDLTMMKMLDITGKDEANANEEVLSQYLKSIRDGFGYTMVFAVNDATKAYFTYDGVTKYLEPETNDQDIWYKFFTESDTEKPYLLDVDIDKVNDWALSVFVNTEVKNENGEFIGLCGVGVDMTELQRLLEHFERIYDVKINLINEKGLIQVDTNATRIENEYIEIDDLQLYSDGECYYEIDENGSRTIIYIDDLEWYLVVQNNRTLNSNVSAIVIPNIICMVVGVILIFIVFVYDRRKNEM